MDHSVNQNALTDLSLQNTVLCILTNMLTDLYKNRIYVHGDTMILTFKIRKKYVISLYYAGFSTKFNSNIRKFSKLHSKQHNTYGIQITLYVQLHEITLSAHARTITKFFFSFFT